MALTRLQKEQITNMRWNGDSYNKIANTLGLSKSTVSTFCLRNKLGNSFLKTQEISNKCKCCGNPLNHIQGSKKKIFCSDTCRTRWWGRQKRPTCHPAVYSFICEACGDTFHVYGDKHRKYCSRECYHKSIPTI